MVEGPGSFRGALYSIASRLFAFPERLNEIVRLSLLVCLTCLPLAAVPQGCVGNLPVGSFRLSVQPERGAALPVREVNMLRSGQKIVYEPVQLPEDAKEDGEIAVLVAPMEGLGDDVVILNPQKAAAQAIWSVPVDTSVVALIFGPQGLNMKKLKSLMVKDPQLLSQLAGYAEQNSKVGALVEALYR